MSKTFPRGSEWRAWDLHVHTPASFEWKGEQFSPNCDQPRDYELVDEMILALNAATPAVFAIMDYWTFDGWFALKRRLNQPNAPTLKKTVFPGIELRLSGPVRLNAHAIFSDQIADQDLNDFLSRLQLELTSQPLSKAALIGYARRANTDKLKHHGFNKEQVEADEELALRAGQAIAELSSASYREALRLAPSGRAIGYMPFSTYGGLGSVKWAEHYAFALSLFETSPIFEARDDATWNAFVGRKVKGNEGWVDNFQEALNRVPRLPVSGSDAHRFVGVRGDNDQRGYGDFPGDRITWIKANPSWLGLLQAIKEPQKRVHIGPVPPKLKRIAENKTFYIDSVELTKNANSTLADNWFRGTELPLNPDLVAIIGNKGSGKSALADIIALLGNSQEKKHFSFLRPDRFRGKSGEPARQFDGALRWMAGEPSTANLADDPSPDRVELVRYIPQGRFEALCNDHVAGRSDAFERELRSVIFSHIPVSARFGALTFDQLIETQEKTFRSRLSEARKRLANLNRMISALEEERDPVVRRNIEEQQRLKRREISELVAIKPQEIKPPSDKLTEEQRQASGEIASATSAIQALETKEKELRTSRAQNAIRRRRASLALERIALFQSQIAEAEQDLAEDLERLGLSFGDIVKVDIQSQPLNDIVAECNRQDVAITSQETQVAESLASSRQIISEATTLLNGPQQAYQAYQLALKQWEEQLSELKGAADVPDSELGLEARIKQLDELPTRLVSLEQERIEIFQGIYDTLEQQRSARASLFAPLQRLISDDELVRNGYKLQFQSNLSATPEAIAEALFSIVKQHSGELRGDEESRAAIKKRYDAYDMKSKDGALLFAQDLRTLLHEAARKQRSDSFDLRPVLRKDRVAAEAYDVIFGLEYLSPQYTLLFQDMPIEQLSPGQRGALLLIFYLLVDKGRNPIILDQPEENLDNETIVSLLVPVLNQAKQTRQIIMVTHNPNLAVVCDAEQIIVAQLERKSGTEICYLSGAIEDPELNECVVNILEGTKLAFNNRGGKYH